MNIADRISELREAINQSHSLGDWRQRTAHPEEREASGWGSSDVIAENPKTKKWEKVARVYDSGNMMLVLKMREHIEALISFAESRPT
jgi:hypothetical protein